MKILCAPAGYSLFLAFSKKDQKSDDFVSWYRAYKIKGKISPGSFYGAKEMRAMKWLFPPLSPIVQCAGPEDSPEHDVKLLFGKSRRFNSGILLSYAKF